MDALWPASSLLVGLSAWQTAKYARAPRDQSLRLVIVPVVCGLLAVVLLAFDHFSRLNGLTVTLAAVTLLLVLVRTALLFAENGRVLAHSREEALTDPLTGLRNRRSLMADLELLLPEATAEHPLRAGAVRPRRLQGVQRRLRPPGRRRAAGTAGRAARRRGARPRAGLPARRRRVLRRHQARPGGARHARRRLRGGAGRARRGLRRRRPLTAPCRLRWRRPAPPRRSSWPTGACTPARASGACRPAASRATCCCAACPSASPTCTSTCAAPPSSPSPSDASWACTASSSTTSRTRPSCTTSARSPSPTRSSRSRARSTTTEWGFMRQHTIIGERILSAAPALRPRGAPRALEPRALGRHGLPGRARRRGDPARRARGRRLRRLRRDDHRPPLPPPHRPARRALPSCAAAPGRSSTRAWWTPSGACSSARWKPPRSPPSCGCGP